MRYRELGRDEEIVRCIRVSRAAPVIRLPVFFFNNYVRAHSNTNNSVVFCKNLQEYHIESTETRSKGTNCSFHSWYASIQDFRSHIATWLHNHRYSERDTVSHTSDTDRYDFFLPSTLVANLCKLRTGELINTEFCGNLIDYMMGVLQPPDMMFCTRIIA